jgi:putative NADH-flavin reductase
MKIAIIGATGTIGSRIAQEALARGHSVTAVARDPAKVKDGRVKAVRGDVTDPAGLAQALKGHDAVVSAVGPAHGGGPDLVVTAARALAQALPRAGVKRVIFVGGAGSLEVKPGLQVVDSPGFPEAWKPVALAHRDALNVWRNVKDLDWTYLSPAALIEPGKRTGKYRTGGDQLLTDAKGESRISAEDYAVAVLDELEKPRNVRRRMTVAY